MTEDDHIRVDVDLDLARPDDRRTLVAEMDRVGFLARPADECLHDFRRWFPGRHFEFVYASGTVSVPLTEKDSYCVQLRRLIELTETLRELSGARGFDHLISGLANARQVPSTIFEIQVARWCAAREVHTDLEFSPEVTTPGGIKRPEFRWKTRFGDLFCECKRASLFSRSDAARLNQLRAVAASAADDAGGVPETLRVEIVIASGLGPDPEQRVRDVVARVLESNRAVASRGLTAKLVLRATEPDAAPGSMVTFRQQLGTVSTPVNAQHADVCVVRSFARARSRAIRDLARDARMQLAPDNANAFFVDIGAGDDLPAILESVVTNAAAVPLVFASAWHVGAPAASAWRNGRPFDNRLLVER